MAKAKKEAAREPAEFPKPLVRLQAAVGGYDAEVRMVADSDGETAAKAEGFQAVTVPVRGGLERETRQQEAIGTAAAERAWDDRPKNG